MSAASCCSPAAPDFAGSYDVGLHPAFREMEQHVLGCQYGGTSWTTRTQAERITSALKLDVDSHVLDVGGGAGWPSLHLAEESRCRITVVDMPENALRIAQQRAQVDGLADNIDVVCGDGTALPFDDGRFQYVVHADVLCCLPDKAAFLRECRRVVQPQARMHFSVILPAAGLSPDKLGETVEHGPPFVDLDGDYESLLQETGWTIVAKEDKTREYRDCMYRLVDFMTSHPEGMTDALGASEYSKMLAHRENQRSLIDDGSLIREVFLVEVRETGAA